MKIARWPFLLLLVLLGSSAHAQTRTVIPDVSYLQTHDLQASPYISVTCYYSSATCTGGGGDFDLVETGPLCAGTPADNAVVIKDNRISGGPDCFHRKNFGLNGVVDARQCGVVGDGATDDQAALKTCLGLAITFKIRVVNTGSGVILDNTADIVVPANIELTCGGRGTGVAVQDDYRISSGLTNAIVLDPAYTIRLSAANSSLSGCTLEAGPGASNTNPYSPAVYFPGCKDTALPCHTLSDPSLRSALNEYSAFNPNPSAAYPTGGPASGSVAISITAENVSVRNVTVLGFGTCYRSYQDSSGNDSKRPVIDHLTGDCDTGISVDQSPDATQFNGFSITPLLTGKSGGAAAQTMKIDDIANSGGAYAVVVEVGPHPTDFAFANGDTVWINTTDHGGAESASGRWTVSGVTSLSGSPCLSTSCQKFTLAAPVGSMVGSTSQPITVTANISNVPVKGVPSTAITGIVGTNQSLISVGQTVSDVTNPGCIPSGTKVVDVWQAKSIVYLSAPSACAHLADSIQFQDDPFAHGNDCVAQPANGCAVVDANIRFGDGMVVTHSGGVSVVNCQVYDHMIAYHMSTGANATRFANCATGDNVTLPDNAFVGLQIDGNHMSDNGDACGIDWANGVLGQFRPVSVLINSDCTTPNKIVNAGIASSNGRRNGSSLELDAGALLLANAKAGPSSNMLVADYPFMIQTAGSGYVTGDTLTGTVTTIPGATCSNVTISITAVDSVGGVAGYSIVTPGTCLPIGVPVSMITWSGGHGTGFNSYTDLATMDEVDANRLNISNNALPKTTLYLENATAAANTAGCGNVFVLPTPYLCAPPLAGLTPGGRLTLCATPPCPAVMTQAVTGASTVYYVPYVGQQVPLYNTAVPLSAAQPSSFTLADIGSAGLALNLDSSHVISNIYDIFAENVRTGAVELCSGTAWSSLSTRAIDLTQVQGVWVNAASIGTCKAGSGPTLACPAYACTYLGTMYATGTGQTSQQIGSISAAGGGANCLCLYNAYNRVTVTAASLDSSASYSYAANVWRPMNAATPPYRNRVAVLDGLAQMTISAELSDALNKNGSGGGPAAMSIAFDPILSSPFIPVVFAQNSATVLDTLSMSAGAPPARGLHYVQAMENAASGASATFGGMGYQQLRVDVFD